MILDLKAQGQALALAERMLDQLADSDVVEPHVVMFAIGNLLATAGAGYVMAGALSRETVLRALQFAAVAFDGTLADARAASPTLATVN